MTTDEIIEAKSNEIRRLHKACNAKDKVIQKAIDYLNDREKQVLPITAAELARELKENMQ